MAERHAVRFRPVIPVTVAIERERQSHHFGVIADISESGASIWTDGVFVVGDDLVVQLSAARSEQSLQVVGRVVWLKPEGEEQDTIRYGVQWAGLQDSQQARLKELIARSH